MEAKWRFDRHWRAHMPKEGAIVPDDLSMRKIVTKSKRAINAMVLDSRRRFGLAVPASHDDEYNLADVVPPFLEFLASRALCRSISIWLGFQFSEVLELEKEEAPNVERLFFFNMSDRFNM